MDKSDYIVDQSFQWEIPIINWRMINPFQLESSSFNWRLIDSNGDSLWSNTYSEIDGQGVDKAYSVVQVEDGSFVFCGLYNNAAFVAKTEYAEPLVSTTINIPDDYATIQAGIDAASDGDTVLVAAGTYVENINYNGKNIAVVGENRETTIIDGNQKTQVSYPKSWLKWRTFYWYLRACKLVHLHLNQKGFEPDVIHCHVAGRNLWFASKYRHHCVSPSAADRSPSAVSSSRRFG